MNPLHPRTSNEGHYDKIVDEEPGIPTIEDLTSGRQHPFSGYNSVFPTCAYQTALGDKPGFQENAARERSRVKTLRGAFLELQRSLPAVPPDTKLSKLDVLVLATTYIAHLMRSLSAADDDKLFASNGILHPVKKWPMRSRLYAGILSNVCPIPRNTTVQVTSDTSNMQIAQTSAHYYQEPQQMARSKEIKTQMYKKILS